MRKCLFNVELNCVDENANCEECLNKNIERLSGGYCHSMIAKYFYLNGFEAGRINALKECYEKIHAVKTSCSKSREHEE